MLHHLYSMEVVEEYDLVCGHQKRGPLLSLLPAL